MINLTSMSSYMDAEVEQHLSSTISLLIVLE